MLRTVARTLYGAYRRAQIARLGSAPAFRRIPAGFEMRIDPRDWPDQHMFLGAYEPALERILRAVVRPGDACIDIGTHKGFFTLLMAQLVGPSGRVLALDPDPRAFSEVNANCARNHFHHVTRLQLAAGHERGTCELTLSRQLGWSSRFPNQLAEAHALSTIRVETEPLDELLARAPLGRPIRFVKIDAEGSEPLILAGMERTLREERPIVSLEINPGSLEKAGVPARALRQRLLDQGYAMYRVAAHRATLGAWLITLRPITDGSQLDEPMDVVCADPTHRTALEAFVTR